MGAAPWDSRSRVHTRSTCRGPAHVSPLWPAQATPSAWTLASSQRGGRHWAPLSCRRCGPRGGSAAASPAGEGLVPMGRPWVPCLVLAWCPLPGRGLGLGAGASSDDKHEFPALGTKSLPEPCVVPWPPRPHPHLLSAPPASVPVFTARPSPPLRGFLCHGLPPPLPGVEQSLRGPRPASPLPKGGALTSPRFGL